MLSDIHNLPYIKETIWCTQKAMAVLFDVGIPAISSPVAGLDYKAFEIPFWQETGYLSENVLPEMHIYTKFDLDAKVRISKVRQGFCDLLYCA